MKQVALNAFASVNALRLLAYRKPKPYITPHARHVFLAAADWLEVNPDKHITGRLAATTPLGPRDGTSVNPTDPSATCFCALGRIAKEANIHIGTGLELDRSFENYFAEHVPGFDLGNREQDMPKGRKLTTLIYDTNDRREIDDAHFGRRKVITLLRDIANGKHPL